MHDLQNLNQTEKSIISSVGHQTPLENHPTMSGTSGQNGTVVPYQVRFPQREEHSIAQEDESCEVTIDGKIERIRFHDYPKLYRYPGLYEQVISDELDCCSPKVVVDLLETQLAQLGGKAPRVFDVGAGNGIVGEELRRIGVKYIVGCDILQEAAVAAERDRPGLYSEYIVADLTALPEEDQKRLANADLNCLVIVGALGSGHIPTEAFLAAFGYIASGGLIGFNVKDDLLNSGHFSGFAEMMRDLVSNVSMEILAQKSYRHRLSVTGEPIMYTALVARKLAKTSGNNGA